MMRALVIGLSAFAGMAAGASAQMRHIDFDDAPQPTLPTSHYVNRGIAELRLVEPGSGPGGDRRLSVVEAAAGLPAPASGRGLTPFVTLSGMIGNFELLLFPPVDYFSLHAFKGEQAVRAVAFSGTQQVAQMDVPAEPGRIHVHLEVGQPGEPLMFDRVVIEVSPGIYPFDPEAGPGFFDALTIHTPASPSITDLGMLPTQGTAMAFGVSGDGSTVVGTSSGGTPNSPAFRWTEAGGIEGLMLLDGHTSGWGLGASGDGSVAVGWTASSAAGSARAVRWTANGIESLGEVVESGAWGISADGSVIAGLRRISNQNRAFIWTVSGPQDLGTLPGGSESTAYSVSADGTAVAGWSDSAHGRRPFRWTAAGGMEDLGGPGGCTWSPPLFDTAISADGSTVVGTCTTASGVRPMRWNQGMGMVELPLLPGTTAGQAWAVSGDGAVVVGSSGAGPSLIGRAAMWTSEGVVDLNELLEAEAAGWTLWTATGISADGGTIAGVGFYWGRLRAWRATLAEEPCYANCDGSTAEPILTIDDFTCFIDAFAHAQTLPHSEQITHYANCDGSTVAPVLTIDDFTCFINEFAGGCD